MTKQPKVSLRYFDYLLAALKDNSTELEKSFGRHVHWGYWAHPKQAKLTTDDFAEAEENLSVEVCQAAKINHKQKILDVGCGFGGTIAHLNENYQNLELTGVNLDDRQLQRAKQKVQAIDKNKIQFIQANASSLPFPDNSFDVVLAVECIFHFPDRKIFFQEALRVLKPGGYFALSDFVPTWPLLPLMKMNLREPINHGFYGKCNVECTLAGYKQLAKQTGFKLQLENDITTNTLPTYSYLRATGMKEGYSSKTAMLETLSVEILSRTRLLRYYILCFMKSK